jgi:hypothetical protein
VAGLGCLWEAPQESIQEPLCEFVHEALGQGIVREVEAVLDWILEKLPRPVRGHMWILADFCGQFCEAIEARTGDRRLIEFVLDLGAITDEELAVQTIKFLKALADVRWPPFFDYFPVDFLLSHLKSDDHRIVQVGVSILAPLVLHISEIEDVVRGLLDGMFTVFDEFSVATALRAIVRAAAGGACSRQNVADAIRENLRFKSPEADNFIGMFLRPEGCDFGRLLDMAKKMIAALYRDPAPG